MKKFASITALFLVIIAVWYSGYRTTPHQISEGDTALTSFATARAMEHVKNMTQTTHYTGSSGHGDTQQYIMETLQSLGLQPELQEGYALSKIGTLGQVQNIITTLQGSQSGKALLLMAHYDSHPHSAYGASDDASGVATILEGIRTYQARGKTPRNDIHILFTDGEELGLLGANLFVREHPLAQNIGLALNFEARGSGGPAFMLVETTGGNRKLLQEFSKAKVPFPVANSLAYSVYKKMPNDTDLTVFREQVGIPGFNFAFIDDHFDYHTAQDTWDRLDPNTLQHQGTYLMALLPHLANTDLDNLQSNKDQIYFEVPVFGLVQYPYDWRYPLLGLLLLCFVGLVIYGLQEHRLSWSGMRIGFIPAVLVLGLSVGTTFLGGRLMGYMYPQYAEILQGFPYNGHRYILAFALLSVGIGFRVYGRFRNPQQQLDLWIAPLFLWIITVAALTIYLPGASYYTLLGYFGLVSLWVRIRQQQPHPYLLLLLVLPALFVLTPFVKDFPIALGLKALFLSALWVSFLFLLALPLIGGYRRKKTLGGILLWVALGFLIQAHIGSDFDQTRKKPNSLLYVLDGDQNKAFWATYDQVPDPWTSNYIAFEKTTGTQKPAVSFYSKYGSTFTHTTLAPMRNIRAPRITITQDTLVEDRRQLTLCIAPQRQIHRMDLFVDKNFRFERLTANGITAQDFVYTNGQTYNAFTKRWDDRLLTYYANASAPLELQMQFHKDSGLEITLYESSFDLLDHELLTLPQRTQAMMPKPFVLNDAVVVKKTIRL